MADNIARGMADAAQSAVNLVSTQINEFDALFNSTSAKESAVLGAELLDATGWTATGWTGDFATGFTHTAGNTSALSRVIPSTGTKMYQIEFDVSTALDSGELTLSIGNSLTYDLYIGSLTHVSAGIKSVSDGNLVLTPISGFNKTITNLSVKEITAARAPTTIVKDSNEDNSVEIYNTVAALKNLFMGQNSGKYNTTGRENVSAGYGALEFNTSGFWNAALGFMSQNSNTVGSRNVSVGPNTLSANISGLRNNAFGSGSLYRNTIGINNQGFGCDTLFYNTIGSHNFAGGFAALYSNVDGDNNIGIGEHALYFNVNGDSNVGIGDYAAQRVTISEIVAIGKYSCYGLTTGIENTGVGTGSCQRNVTGQGNACFGYIAGYGVAGASYNRNTIMGARAGIALDTAGDDNTLIGYKAGDSITTGKRNICIGSDIDVASATGNDQLNIGGAILGNLATKIITIEKLILSALPTADPHVTGQVWNNSNALAISAG